MDTIIYYRWLCNVNSSLQSLIRLSLECEVGLPGSHHVISKFLIEILCPEISFFISTFVCGVNEMESLSAGEFLRSWQPSCKEGIHKKN